MIIIQIEQRKPLLTSLFWSWSNPIISLLFRAPIKDWQTIQEFKEKTSNQVCHKKHSQPGMLRECFRRQIWPIVVIRNQLETIPSSRSKNKTKSINLVHNLKISLKNSGWVCRVSALKWSRNQKRSILSRLTSLFLSFWSCLECGQCNAVFFCLKN